MKNIFLNLTTFFTLAAASACAHSPTMVEDADELDSIESMLLMVDDDAVPIPTVTVNYAGDSTRTRRSVNTRGKPSFRVVIHRLQRHILTRPLSNVRLQETVELALKRAQANLEKLWAMREVEKECRAAAREAGVQERCSLKRKMRPIVRDTRQLLNRIIMAIRADRRNRGGR